MRRSSTISIALALTAISILFGCMTLRDSRHELISNADNWVVYYANQLPSSKFSAYDIVVFDDAKHPAIAPLRDRPRLILGYVSFGESGALRPFPVHDHDGMKLAENQFWPGNYILDIRKPAWRDFLIKEHIPSILAKGFDGIMIDTIDSPLHHANRDETLYPSMKKAAIELIRATREAFPDIVITLNRGFDILPQVAPYIDLVLVESTLANYNFDSKESAYFPANIHLDYVATIRAAQAANPKLRALSLDYWNPQDEKSVADLYRYQRANGFIPYVSTVALDTIYPEP